MKHFAGTSNVSGPTTLVGGLPVGARVEGDAFDNFRDTYTNGAGDGELANPAGHPSATSLQFDDSLPASRKFWFGNWGAPSSAGFDLTLPSTDGVMQLFAGGFGAAGATLSVDDGTGVLTESFVNEKGHAEFGAQFTLVWTNEQVGDVLSIDLANDPAGRSGNTGLIGAFD